jgi:hypothetical protein
MWLMKVALTGNDIDVDGVPMMKSVQRLADEGQKISHHLPIR